jgi:manganese/zinc/iron transport system ATP- binding protein
MLENAITIEHLTVLYGSYTALMDISCVIPSGVICALVGPNGAGKTTLLKTVVGLVTPLAGSIHIFGKSFRTKTQNLFAYVPQRTVVDWNFPISVYDVVMMGRYAHISFFKKPSVQDIDYVYEALIAVNMLAYKDTLIGELSGGQQQRVFLARALAQRAPLLLLDEPFTGVDNATELIIIQVLQQLRSQGVTVVIVHHDLATVGAYADWAMLIRQTLIKAGALDTVFVQSHLIQAYGTSVLHAHKEYQVW